MRRKSPRKNDYKLWKVEVVNFLENTFVDNEKEINMMLESNNFDQKSFADQNSLEYVNEIVESAKKWSLDTDNTTYDNLIGYKASLDMFMEEIERKKSDSLTKEEFNNLIVKGLSFAIDFTEIFEELEKLMEIEQDSAKSSIKKSEKVNYYSPPNDIFRFIEQSSEIDQKN